MVVLPWGASRQGSGRLQELRHPAAIVVESRELQDGERQRHIFPQDIPAHAADAGQRKRRRPRRNALGPPVHHQTIIHGHASLPLLLSTYPFDIAYLKS
jgi:hypothetical protein